MSRWNLVSVRFYSQDERTRDLDFSVGEVNIITGDSNTGKTAIIRVIDYCLGSSKCRVPSYIKERTTYVGTKWSDGITEILLVRAIPRGTSKTTTQIFVTIGSKVEFPDTSKEFKGKTSIDQARLIFEKALGIKEAYHEETGSQANKSRITIRQATPYMLLTKEVVDSSSTLLHGLDDSRAAPLIIGAIPYFLGAQDAEEVAAGKRLKQLIKAIEYEQRKKASFETEKKTLIHKCQALVREAIQVGILEAEAVTSEINLLKPTLVKASNWKALKTAFSDNAEMATLIKNRAEHLANISKLRRKKKAAQSMDLAAEGFSSTVDRQYAKVKTINFFEKTSDAICPVCSSEILEASDAVTKIYDALETLKLEKSTVEANRPVFNDYMRGLDDEINSLKESLMPIDDSLSTLVAENESAKKQVDESNRAVKVSGRISYFLDSIEVSEEYNVTKLESYSSEKTQLEAKYDQDKLTQRLQRVEGIVSGYSSEVLNQLPSGYPCAGNKIEFISKVPSLFLYDVDRNREYVFDDVGSDENYLSLHLSLVFGLQRFFGEVNRPVPGLIIIDQVSRPYFSQNGRVDQDEVELAVDQDTQSLMQYFNFIFDEVAARKGLQVIILEHAYFPDDERYSKAVKYRWKKVGVDKLIPLDWPTV